MAEHMMSLVSMINLLKVDVHINVGAHVDKITARFVPNIGKKMNQWGHYIEKILSFIGGCDEPHKRRDELQILLV